MSQHICSFWSKFSLYTPRLFSGVCSGPSLAYTHPNASRLWIYTLFLGFCFCSWTFSAYYSYSTCGTPPIWWNLEYYYLQGSIFACKISLQWMHDSWLLCHFTWFLLFSGIRSFLAHLLQSIDWLGFWVNILSTTIFTPKSGFYFSCWNLGKSSILSSGNLSVVYPIWDISV